MVSNLLLRGMLVGLLAGLLVFAFGRYFGEPLVERAISFETLLGQTGAGHDKAHAMGASGMHEHSAHTEGDELVSRPVQAGWGLFTGVMVYSTALGGLFALAFSAVHQRAVILGPRATSVLLAASGFVSVYLIPNLKYPANPPAVGAAETIGDRTALYFMMLACSIGAMILAGVLRKRLAERHHGWTAAYAALGFYVVIMVVVAISLPAVNEVPGGFPAAVLWQFRMTAFGMQVVMWTTFGVVFGALTERAWARDRIRHRPTTDVLTAS